MTDTREAWLHRAEAKLRQRFADAGHPLPETIHLSVGLPKSRKAIGECWAGEQSSDGNKHIFISPTLEAYDALDTLVHELVHVALPPDAKHKKPFVKLGNALGLTEGKPTSLSAGPELKAELQSLLLELGDYPHAKLDTSTGKKPQSTRLVKASCSICDYTVRTTQKWLDYAGAPLCPATNCEAQQMKVEGVEAERGRKRMKRLNTFALATLLIVAACQSGPTAIACKGYPSTFDTTRVYISHGTVDSARTQLTFYAHICGKPYVIPPRPPRDTVFTTALTLH